MIIVDSIIKWPNARGIFRAGSCHMSSTESEAELHEFAKRIGLRREWFQAGRHPHYDLTPRRRAIAIRAGAQEVQGRDMIRLHYAGQQRTPVPGESVSPIQAPDKVGEA